MARHVSAILLLCFNVFSVALFAAEKTFYSFNREQGLSGEHVLQMMQLKDGRIVVDTESDVCLYDGTQFKAIRKDSTAYAPLPDYDGFTKLFVDRHYRLWVKNRWQVVCLDLRTLCFVDSCTALLAGAKEGGAAGARPVGDFYVDTQGYVWTVDGRTVRRDDGTAGLLMPDGCGRVQDLDTYGGRTYVFTSDGSVSVFGAKGGRPLSVHRAYSRDEAPLHDRTSLVVRGSDGMFYQTRMGRRSLFLSFNPRTGEWRRLFECDYNLHTLIVTPERKAYISTDRGYWLFDLATGSRTLYPELRLPDGTMFATGFNTICQDREGGIWLGSYDKGVFYSSPMNGVFDTREYSPALTPVLTSVFLHGRRLGVGESGMTTDAAFTERLTMKHSDNALAFQFSAMKFVRPRSTFYRYRIVEQDKAWHVVSADSAGNMVDGRGQFYLSFVGMQPGTYTIEVMASARADRWDGGVRRLVLVIRSPWWATVWAYTAYALILILTVFAAVRAYTRSISRKAERKRREDMLLTRIQSLVKKCSQLESSASVVLSDREETDGRPQMSNQEIEFMNRATAFVEKNMSNPSYSVEQLSRDLCMERTGLYRKLMAAMDKSPVAFIRTIRLTRAAELIAGGGRSIAEVAEMTGFSSPGYFSKCFMQQYGCRPSEYTGNDEWKKQ